MANRQSLTGSTGEKRVLDPNSPGQTDIGSLIEPYRNDLLLHSYRLLGSLHDAEDAVQETMLRAWRHFDSFSPRGPGGLRAWLYTIATNTCLDTLKKRSFRTLPVLAFAEADLINPLASRNTEMLWLEPFPDHWLAQTTQNPEARYLLSESVSLAFLTALQLLPPRQRAILILSDVLDWRASEIALLLQTSVSAVNSGLHRARVTLEKNYTGERRGILPVGDSDEKTRALLSRYLKAWEADDVEGLVALLKEDATLSMPPVPSWYRGREAIGAILRTVVFRAGIKNRWRLVATQANGQPAFVLYRLDETKRIYKAYGVQLVTLADSGNGDKEIADVTAFLVPSLAPSFGFPPQLED